MFNKNITAQLNKKKIVLVGRGSTARFAEKLNDNYYLIGLNIDKVFNRKINLYINTREIQKKYLKKIFKKIKVGSIYFYLFNIISEINKILKKKKIYIFLVLILKNIPVMTTFIKKNYLFHRYNKL